MDELRTQRVASALKREISDILANDIEDSRVGFVSITDVELTADMRQAKVYFSVLGEGDDKRKATEGLHSAAGYIRTEVARRVSLRHAPELVFLLDESIERGVRVIDLMSRLAKPPVSE